MFFLATIVGTFLAMLQDPCQIALFAIQLIVALTQKQWWPLLVVPIAGAVMIALLSYPRYSAAGLDAWPAMGWSFAARFLLLWLVGVTLLAAAKLVFVGRTQPRR